MKKMSTEKNPKNQNHPLKYDRVVVADIRRSRRGRHHELVRGIFEDLETLPPGSAMKIPLGKVDGTTLANLRSAVHRASTSKGLTIQTLSDEDNFYIWQESE
jgi:hypothetical protein